MSEEAKDNIREEILNAASIAFNKFGYKKTTLDDIASLLNRGKSGIYYYFKNKDEVFQAVVVKESEIFKQKMHSLLSEKYDFGESIEVYVKNRIDTFQQLGNFYGTLKTDAFDHLQFINYNRNVFDNAEMEVLINFLNRFISKELSLINETEKLAYTMMNILKGFESQFSNPNNLASLEEQRNILIKILCCGLVKK